MLQALRLRPRRACEPDVRRATPPKVPECPTEGSLRALPDHVIEALEANLRLDTPAPWAVWLVGHLARTRVAGAVAGLEASAPQLHYAITLLWSFVESWIARRWELNPGPILPPAGEAHDVDDTV